MGVRKQATRVAAVLAGAAIAALATALPAVAQTSGVVDGHDQDGPAVALHYTDDGGTFDGPVPTSLIGLRLADGHKVETYCVQLTVDTQPNAHMDEASWAQHPVDPNSRFSTDAAQVNWVVHNSFPAMALGDVAAAAGVPGLAAPEVIAGTQAAIWHYSNGATPSASETDQHVLALYRYLTGPRNTGIAQEPASTLTLAPDQRTGPAGDRIGPFTVDTTATTGRLRLDAPAGVTLIDAQGSEIPTGAATGRAVKAAARDSRADLFLRVPPGLPAGSAKVTLDGQATLEVGRLFVGHDQVRTQALIVATPAPVAVSAAAVGTWTPAAAASAPAAPTPAATAPRESGLLGWPLVLLVALLVAAAVAAVVVQRRRRGGAG